MSITYTYSLTDDILSGDVNIAQLQSEVDALSIGATMSHVERRDDDVTLFFSESLTPQNKSILDNTLSTHIKSAGIYAFGQSLKAYAIMCDYKSIGTNAGTFTAGLWVKRTITMYANNFESGELTIADSEFTLMRGNYIIECFCPAYKVDSHQGRLYNVTDNEVVSYGSNEYSKKSQTTSRVFAIFSISSTKTFRLEHRCSKTQKNDGLGRAVGFSIENYAEVRIEKMDMDNDIVM